MNKDVKAAKTKRIESANDLNILKPKLPLPFLVNIFRPLQDIVPDLYAEFFYYFPVDRKNGLSHIGPDSLRLFLIQYLLCYLSRLSAHVKRRGIEAGSAADLDIFPR